MSLPPDISRRVEQPCAPAAAAADVTRCSRRPAAWRRAAPRAHRVCVDERRHVVHGPAERHPAPRLARRVLLHLRERDHGEGALRAATRPPITSGAVAHRTARAAGARRAPAHGPNTTSTRANEAPPVPASRAQQRRTPSPRSAGRCAGHQQTPSGCPRTPRRRERPRRRRRPQPRPPSSTTPPAVRRPQPCAQRALRHA